VSHPRATVSVRKRCRRWQFDSRLAADWALGWGLPPILSAKNTELRMGHRNSWLWLEDQRRAAESLALEVDSDVDAVADPDEGNAFIHPVVLPVEDHGPMNLA